MQACQRPFTNNRSQRFRSTGQFGRIKDADPNGEQTEIPRRNAVQKGIPVDIESFLASQADKKQYQNSCQADLSCGPLGSAKIGVDEIHKCQTELIQRSLHIWQVKRSGRAHPKRNRTRILVSMVSRLLTLSCLILLMDHSGSQKEGIFQQRLWAGDQPTGSNPSRHPSPSNDASVVDLTKNAEESQSSGEENC